MAITAAVGGGRLSGTFPWHGFDQHTQEFINGFWRVKHLSNVRIEDDGTAARPYPSRNPIGTRFAVVKTVFR
jgi:hypothetical protein